MVTTYKEMKFHRLRMYKFTENSQENEQKFLTTDQENEVLKACLKSIQTSEKIRFKEFKFRGAMVNVEFIYGVDDYLKGKSSIILGKLSSPKDEHAYQIRTNGTATERNLVLTPKEWFEARSYFILDTENMIIGYLHEQAAPSVYSLGEFIYSVSREDNKQSTTFSEVTDIAIKDMLNKLAQMAVIGTITGYYEIPLNLPVDVTGLSEKEYRKLSNQKVIRSTVSLVVNRRGVSAFSGDNIEDPTSQEKDDNEKEKFDFFKGLSANKFLKQLKVRTKSTVNSRMKDTFLDNNPLVYSIPFNYGAINLDKFDQIVCDKLKYEYNMNKSEIQNQYRN